MTFDFLELFNAVAVKQKAVPTDFISAESLDTPIDEDSDSLDITMVFVILGEAYGVNEELDSDWPVSSVGALQAFLLGKKTSRPRR